MTGSGSSAQEPSLTAAPSTDRRKIRKGTRSCWECKRRKNKCTWSSTGGKCDGCHHRGARCVGQEIPEERIAPGGTRAIASSKRLRRLEVMVAALSRRLNSGGTSPGLNDTALSPDHCPTNDLEACLAVVEDNNILEDTRASVVIASQPSLSPLLADYSLTRVGEATDKLMAPLVHALVSAWPSERHHEAILNSNIGLLHPALSSVCSGFHSPPSPKDMLELPSPGTAPVTIARKLLKLGTYIQVISSQSRRESTGPDSEYRVLSSRVFGTVSKLITHNDGLPASVEIIECLIIESQYHNYTGNVRRAWIVLRRAMAIAQMLGLDRQDTIRAHNSNPDEAQAASYDDRIWFLLVHFDQYLSLILGISPGMPENSQVTPGRFEGCTPSEQVGRFHSMAVGRILQRNRVAIFDVAETKEIDKLLQMAAACMPAQWWLPPDWSDDCPDEGFSGVVARIMVHFAHYNILSQVHLPSMLRSLGKNQPYYYGTPTVINCSREVLIRFTAFRSRYPAVSYCRGLDVFAFVASIALCLLHIHSSCEGQTSGSGEGAGISILLAHQRLANRGLMERALQSIEKMGQVEPDDKLACDIAPIFRKLLDVEEEVCRGVHYGIHSPFNARQPSNHDQGANNSSDILSVDIPFCGTIEIERKSGPCTMTTEASNSREMTPGTHIQLSSFPLPSVDYGMMSFPDLQVREGQHTMATESCLVDKHQSSTTTAYNMMPDPAELQPMLYSGHNDAHDFIPVSGLLAPGTTDNIEELWDPMVDTGFLENSWGIE
ncbi:hypothetical protein F4802DRAFT_594072 [Xylaria palmicola]|nr:hypothetical protein F4802DRAFT_594072 [Xylaria palmicola]